MSTTNIIQRRDLEPLWAKACEVARHYEKAGNCMSALIGADFISFEPSKNPKSNFFCALCKRYYSGQLELPLSDGPCSILHRNAVKESLRLGGSYIYTCSLGFFFWTSPFFSMERFAGAFISGGGLSIETQQVLDRTFNACKGDVSRAEIAEYLEFIPEKNIVDIEALAQMMSLCTERLSRREPYWDIFAEGNGDKNLAYCDDSYQEFMPKGCLPNFMDKERLLLASLRRGDSIEAQKIARKMLGDLCDVFRVPKNDSSSGNFEYLKLKVIEILVLLSRAGTTAEKDEVLVETSSQHLKRIKDSNTANEVIENFCLVVERMAGKLFSFQGVRHASALRKAERFIWENYTRKVSLKEIADVSKLSAPYFSTIFKNEMGENLSDYLNRLRVEKATAMLKETDLLISEISTACGFEDQSWFSKIFKNYTGISPCKYRRTMGIVPIEQNFSNRQVEQN